MSRPDRKAFRRVRPEKDATAKTPSAENEVRVTSKGSQRVYIAYAIAVLTGADGKTQHDSVKISGIGGAIYNVVNIAEIVKRRVKGLHQTTDIGSQSFADEYEPLEEGKEGHTVERKVSSIVITLSTKPLNTKHIGYQAPLPDSEVTEQEDRPERDGEERPPRGGRGRRGGRGSRGGPREASTEDKPAAADGEAKPARERRPRGGRGRSERGAGAGAADGEARPPRAERGGRGSRGGRGGARPERDGEERPRGGRGGRGGSRGGRGGRGADRDDEPRTFRGGRGSGRGGARPERDGDERPRGRGSRGGRGGEGRGRGGEGRGRGGEGRGGRGGSRGSGRGGARD